MRQDNPVRGVLRFADEKRERRLSDDEYAVLGAALRKAEMESIWPPAVAAIRFLALTGWRSGEALGLRWKDMDLARQRRKLAGHQDGSFPTSALTCRRRRPYEPQEVEHGR
jgi:integrase